MLCYHLTIRMVCVSVCFLKFLFAPHHTSLLTCGLVGAEGKARHLWYSNQQVNKSILRSRFFWCSSFFFVLMLIMVHNFFPGNFWTLKFWTKTEKPKGCQRCHRTVSTTPSMMCWSPGGGKRLMSTMNGIFFGFSAASGMAWSRDWYMLTAEICWHIPGIYLAYTWHILGIYLAVYVNGCNLLKHRRLCKWVSQTSAGMLLYWWKLTGKVLKHFLLNP